MKHAKPQPYRALLNRLLWTTGCLFLVLTLLVSATLAWFSMENETTKGMRGSVGQVRYRIEDSDRLFYRAFEFDEYEEEFDDEQGYVAAERVDRLLLEGETLAVTSNQAQCTLPLYTKAKLSLVLYPIVSTDRITFSSTDENIVTVSAYGTLFAVGRAGEQAVITITVTDRNPTPAHDPFVYYVSVTVIASEGELDDNYGYLPGNVNLLRNPLTLINTSNVPTKARVRVEWTYSEYEEEITPPTGAADEKQSVTFAELSEGIPTLHPENIVIGSGLNAPLSVTCATGWQVVPAQTDEVAIGSWTLDILSLTEAQQTAFRTALSGGAVFSLGAQMIDSAHTYLCHSDTEITSAASDYGTPISPNTAQVVAATALTVSDGYVQFSSHKKFSVSISLQARQATAYEGLLTDEETFQWFDVYCLEQGHTS